jgi:signal transduction histidine kinase
MSTPDSALLQSGTAPRTGASIRSLAIAAAAALAAFAARWAVGLMVGPPAEGKYPFAATIIAVVLVSWHVGWVPSLVTLVLGFLLADWSFVLPIHSFSSIAAVNLGGTISFFLVGSTIIFFGRSMRLARERADANAREAIANQKQLEQEVAERRRIEAEVRRLNAGLEERVLQRTAELRATNQELEAFTYSVSHDLRAPIRHMDGFALMLEEEFGPQLTPDARHCIARIRRASQNMGQLVDDLLDLSRVGKMDLNREPVDLKDLVESVVTDLRPQLGDRRIEWRIGNLPTVGCDPGLTRIIFANLLSNSAKYTRTRDPATVEVDQVPVNGETVLRVRDNGVGFDMKHADKLFGVFQRLHRAEEFEGTGVGLATVLRVVHKHCGRIWAESRPGEGASFYFTLGPSDKTTKPGLQANGEAGASDLSALPPTRNPQNLQNTP